MSNPEVPRDQLNPAYQIQCLRDEIKRQERIQTEIIRMKNGVIADLRKTIDSLMAVGGLQRTL